MSDSVNHPEHYTKHPSGLECIEITEHMNFNLDNAVKYIWRAGLKGDAVEDLKKAAFYIEREIGRRAKAKRWVTQEYGLICDHCYRREFIKND